MIRVVLQDWQSNRGHLRIQVSLALMRFVQAQHSVIGRRVMGAIYKIYSGIILGMDLPPAVRVGQGLQIHHGTGLVVHGGTVIGQCVVIRHSTTIGAAVRGGPAPQIGDYVDIGAHVVVIGGISVGDRATIGAGSVVIKDVAPGSTVVGNPARDLKENESRRLQEEA